MKKRCAIARALIYPELLLNRRQIFDAGSLAPAVTPLVRIPTNGAEKAQW